MIAFAVVAVVAMLCFTVAAHAQSPGDARYFPLNQQTPPGWAAEWSRMMRPQEVGRPQPVRITLPSRGQVTFFQGAVDRPQAADAPALAALQVGRVYRFRISHMPEFPGVELYPSVEVLDRLHPPAGQFWTFPVPLVLTHDDIEHVLAGRLVTRVVYLEQPQLAAQQDDADLQLPRTLAPQQNPLELADRLGRPMLLVRLGGRIPAANESPAAFFGDLPPVQFYRPSEGSTDNRSAQRPSLDAVNALSAHPADSTRANGAGSLRTYGGGSIRTDGGGSIRTDGGGSIRAYGGGVLRPHRVGEAPAEPKPADSLTVGRELRAADVADAADRDGSSYRRIQNRFADSGRVRLRARADADTLTAAARTTQRSADGTASGAGIRTYGREGS